MNYYNYYFMIMIIMAMMTLMMMIIILAPHVVKIPRVKNKKTRNKPGEQLRYHAKPS